MTTPIVDQYVSDNYNVRIFDANHCFDFARRLELDRAALMEALERATTGFHANTTGYFHVEPSDVAFAQSALSVARANFPEQS